MGSIEFTEHDIRAVWKNIFNADVPDSLTIIQVFEACLCEIGSVALKERLQCT